MIEEENPFDDRSLPPVVHTPLPDVVCTDCGAAAYALCGDEHGGPEVPVCWACAYTRASWMP